MIFRSLAIQGFRSFKVDQAIHFGSNPSGFYLIKGENGSGKSSIWDAVCWVLFGVTARGSKGRHVSNWADEHQTSVCFEFDIGSHEYAITRTWSPNSLVLVTDRGEPRVVVQKDIEDLIGFNLETFLSVVLMGQFNRYFLDLSPTEKLTVFSDALDLDYWVAKSKAASTQAAETQKSVTATERDVAALMAAAKEIVAQRDEAKRSVDWWHENQTRLEDEALAEAKEGEVQLERCKAAEASCKAQVAELEKGVQEWSAHINAIHAAVNSHNPEISEARGLIRSLQGQIDLLTRQARENESAGVCRTCGQALPQRTGESIKRDSAAEIAATRHKLAEAEVVLTGLLATQEATAQRLPDKQQTLRQHQGQLTHAQKAEYLAHADVTRAQVKLEASQKKLDQLVSQVNPHAERLKRAAAQYQENQESLTIASGRFTSLVAKLEALNYWAKEFKKIRLWLIEEAIRELEVEASNCLVQLGLPGWKIKFDVERENASGGVTSGFSVLIYPPDFKEPVNWRDWSGGETQRLRIAGNIGLAELIRGRRGVSASLEVWDEPTTFLNESGISDLLAFFEGRCREQNRQIWWMDHRSLNAGVFDGEVHVVKDEHGTKITDLR